MRPHEQATMTENRVHKIKTKTKAKTKTEFDWSEMGLATRPKSQTTSLRNMFNAVSHIPYYNARGLSV